MTADELREIVADCERYERYCIGPEGGEAEMNRRIAALLSLVGQVADLKPRFIHEQGDSCPWPPCGYPLAHPDHASNKACLWLMAQGAKP